MPAVQPIPTIDEIIEKVKEYNPSSDSDMLRRAYQLALQAHGDQKRDSGEPYIMHPLAVAAILADLELDDATIAAGLLHDVAEDTSVTLADIATEFGAEMAKLVDGVTKLSKLEYRSRQEAQAENLRKMLLAMSQDIRVILIKLADRLHNMRTLSSHHSDLRKKEIAEETMEIFAPLAHRLGISKIKWELEDLALRYLEPDKYNSLVEKISMKRVEREAYINELSTLLAEKLKAVGIEADISGRPKNFYSIYNKMKKQKKELNEIYDINAMRIIVDNVKDCYGALGVVHTLWKPIPGRFKDYIAMPKANMYQSIHTTVIGPNGDPFEVQIRTWEMHRISEYGIAAHWRYKEGKSADADFDNKLAWLRQMLEFQTDMKDAGEFMDSVKVDLFVDSVFVFSPRGDVYELPTGATPIDFAYRVHTQVGHQCVGAKVNQRIVTLDYTLQNGDIVEILTAKGTGPSRDWLKIAKTSHAKNKIRQWFRREKRDDSLIQRGREILEKEGKRQNIDMTALMHSDYWDGVVKRTGYFSTEDFLVAVAEGALTPAGVLSKVKEDSNLRREFSREQEATEEKPLALKAFDEKVHDDKGIYVKGDPDVLVRIAHCCNPLPGDEIIGYITRGQGVSIHRASCPNIAYYHKTEPDRLVEASWGNSRGVFQGEIQVIAFDRPRLVMDITMAISELKTTINGVNMRVGKDKISTMDLKLEINSIEQLDYLIHKVSRLPDVIEVKRLTNEKRLPAEKKRHGG